MAGKKKLTRVDIRKQIEELEKEERRLEALESLPDHESVLKVNQTISKAVEETGANELDVRLAELKKYCESLPELHVEVSKLVEQWKKDNATHQNPNNPEETWYSPDGRGNPPKWIKDKIGKKPNSKEKKELKSWMKELDKFRIQEDTQKAA